MQATETVAAVARCSALPGGWQHGAFMEIFVRAWRDGNGDGVGDLRGLIDSLPYLQDLGIKGLWLMPVHPSQDGDHGYAVTDYRAIHPDYGTLDDFDRLLREAHGRGIGVILDYVINHSAQSHPLFQHSRDPRSPYRDWYLWQDAAPAGWQIYGHNPWWRDAQGAGHYFGAFDGRMPDFNWRNPAVAAWHHDNLRFWLDRGVDGFRFDAVGHLVENGPEAWDCQPENYRLMADVRALLDQYPQRYMVCEAPGDPQGFARAAGSAFAFDLSAQLVAAARGQAAALQAVAHYFDSAPPGMATLLANHDAFAGLRVHDQLEGDPAAMRRAAALVLLLPGTPFLYYGEEIGLAGHQGLGGDPGLRTPMSWNADPLHAGFSAVRPFRALSPNAATHNVAAQLGDPRSMHRFYRTLLGLRNGRPSLARGGYRCLHNDGATLVFERRCGGESTVVAVGPRAAAQGAGLRSLFSAPGAGVAVFAGR